MNGAYRSVLSIVLATMDDIKNGRLDEQEVESVLLASAEILATDDKCPEDGCIVKRKGKWRVVSNKTGELWPQTYDTKQDAEDALAAYHLRKAGVPPK